MLNPNKKIAESQGIDIPIMYVYLVGKISGDCMNKCLEWRKEIINYYSNYKERGAYPISFLCPLNSGESKTADKMGLKSHIPKNLIYDKDILSLQKADCIVANLDDFMEVGIEDLLISNIKFSEPDHYSNYGITEAFFRLQKAIINRRANLGSHFEVSIALYLRKPVILIAGNKRNKYILDNHPFFNRASVIVLDTKELLENKWLQILYKSFAGSTEEY